MLGVPAPAQGLEEETPGRKKLGEPIRDNHRGVLTTVPNSIYHLKM